MNLRKRLASWIGGEDFSEAEARQEKLQFALIKANEDIYSEIAARQELSRECRAYKMAAERASIYGDALRRIAEMETPSANATVKRMARMARDARK